MPDVNELLGGAQDAINVKRVFGDPIETEDVTVIPAATVGGGMLVGVGPGVGVGSGRSAGSLDVSGA